MSIGPVPRMTYAVWETIKNLQVEDGGWHINRSRKRLAIVRSDTWGQTEWILWDEDPPGQAVPAFMSFDDWHQIMGALLDSDSNTLDRDGQRYRLVLHYNEDRRVQALVEPAF